VIFPPAASWRLPRRAPEFTLYAAAVGLAVLGGASLVTDARIAKILILLPALLLALTIQPEKLFVAWLFCAPLVQGAAAGDHPGHVLYKILFLGPPLILVARAATGALDLRDLWVIDALPALYVAWVLVSVHLVDPEFKGSSSSLRAIYFVVGVGIIAYYITAIGKTSDRFPTAVARALLWSGIVVAVLALVDAATGWNPWNTTIGGNGQVRRVASTFSGPPALGAYLGAGVAFAVAILLWNGPRSLRLPATLTIGLSITALFFTYTRGPILAIAGVSVFMALVANRARWPSLLAFATVGLLVFAAWGHISSSNIYKERLGVTATVTTREKIQHESVALFRQRPLLGWGYNTFDQLTGQSPTRDPQIQNITSHDTYLTVLVELGVIGLALLVLPWVMISRRAIAAARRGLVEPWIVAGCVGTAVSFWIGALTYDARFFPIITALPWITLGLARNVLGNRRTGVESA
jgi:O-antigen ligase